MKSMLIIASFIAVALANPYQTVFAPVDLTSPIQPINPGAPGPVNIEGVDKLEQIATGPVYVPIDDGPSVIDLAPKTEFKLRDNGSPLVEVVLDFKTANAGGQVGPIIVDLSQSVYGPSATNFAPENVYDIRDGEQLSLTVNVQTPAAVGQVGPLTVDLNRSHFNG